MTAQVIHLPVKREELEAIAQRCSAMVKKRAMVSAGAVLVPIPGLDIAADVALLVQLISRINAEFGLTPEQIARLDHRTKLLVYKAMVSFGGAMIGKVVTEGMVMQALKLVGVRVTAKQAAKYVPVAGQALAAGLSYSAMRLMGERHIKDCQRLLQTVRESMERQASAAHP